MTKQKEVYKCEICGNIVEVLHDGPGELICCGTPMILSSEKTEDPEKGEKHIPVVEQSDNGIVVKIGEVEHPMTEEHYIEWIEIHTENGVLRKNFSPNDKPVFNCPQDKPIKKVRAYCNLHGLWTKNI